MSLEIIKKTKCLHILSIFSEGFNYFLLTVTADWNRIKIDKNRDGEEIRSTPIRLGVGIS